MGKKNKKGKFNQVVDLDIMYSTTSIVDTDTTNAFGNLTLTQEKMHELEKLKSQLPSAPQSVRLEEELSRLPPDGPFRLFMSNIAFTAQLHDIDEFFLPLRPLKVKLAEEDGRFRGFGFVDFETVDELKDALDKSNNYLLNRKINMRIADPNHGDRDSDRFGERGSAVTSRRGYNIGGFDGRDSWGMRGSRGGETMGRSIFGDDEEMTWSRGVSVIGSSSRPMPTQASKSNFRPSDGPPAVSAWGRPSIGPDASSTNSSVVPDRPIIKLAPRTLPLNPGVSPSERLPSKIFGDAKPVDTASKDRAIEARMSEVSKPATAQLGHTGPKFLGNQGLESSHPPRSDANNAVSGSTSADVKQMAKPDAPAANAWSQRMQHTSEVTSPTSAESAISNESGLKPQGNAWGKTS